MSRKALFQNPTHLSTPQNLALSGMTSLCSGSGNLLAIGSD